METSLGEKVGTSFSGAESLGFSAGALMAGILDGCCDNEEGNFFWDLP